MDNDVARKLLLLGLLRCEYRSTVRRGSHGKFPHGFKEAKRSSAEAFCRSPAVSLAES
jgi:hypothetical protein